MAEKRAFALKRGVLIPFEWRELFRGMDGADSELGKAFFAILDYAQYGALPDGLSDRLRLAWRLIQAGLDRDDRSWRNSVRKNGGRVADRPEVTGAESALATAPPVEEDEPPVKTATEGERQLTPEEQELLEVRRRRQLERGLL